MRWETQRLVSEWRLHGKLIIALDFDDTVHPFGLNGPEHVARYEYTLALLRECQLIGADIVINTSSAPERFEEMTDYCTGNGLVISGVNQNTPGLKYGHHGKIYANIYLDDRSGIKDALAILDEAIQAMNRP